jgi:hypothetical protein
MARDTQTTDEPWFWASTEEIKAFNKGVEEGYRRVLASAKTMTREMLIQRLEAEINER